MLLRLLLWAAAIFAGGYITYKVYEHISRSNLAQIIRQALRNSAEASAKKALGKALSVAIRKKQATTITLNLSSDEETFQMVLEGERIADDIREGMKFTLAPDPIS